MNHTWHWVKATWKSANRLVWIMVELAQMFSGSLRSAADAFQQQPFEFELEDGVGQLGMAD